MVVDTPTTLSVERPVEVPQIMTAEAITQVPVAEVAYVEKQIPKVMTEAIEKIQEVPQVLVEEQLVEVPQVQMAEVIRQVPVEVLQPRQRGIPKVTTQVVEKVQQVGVPLVNEVCVEVPQIQTVEVVKQTANLTQQRVVQQAARQFEVGTQAYRTLAEERVAGVYQAPVVGVRDMAMVQPTVVERVNPVMATGMVEYAAQAPVVEYAAPIVEYAAAPGTVVEYVEGVAPTVAPTIYGGEILAA